MKTLVALAAVVSMSGCVVHWPPGSEHADGHKRAAPTVVVCIFASCRDIVKPPEKQETLTPSSSPRKGESALSPHASRRDSGARRKGISPNKP